MHTVGDYSIFISSWTSPAGGIQGYLTRFLASGDATFQHIAIWTLLQLLESEDKKLINLIGKTEEIVQMIRTIADKDAGTSDAGETSTVENGEEQEDGEGEVVQLALRSLQLLGQGEKPHVEG